MLRKIVTVIIKVLIILAPLAIFLWLFVQDTVPSGELTIDHDVGQTSPFIDMLLPDTRAQAVAAGPDGDFQRIIDEPVYAAVHLPGDFQTLTTQVVFKNNDQPIIEAGVLVNADPMQYDLEPLQNTLIDDSTWNRLEENGVTLLQRNPTFTSIEDFLAHPPARSEIATYHYTLNQPYRLAGYQPSGTLTTIDVSLRGYHEYDTYIKNEPLLIQADYMDMNREYGPDPVEIIVFNEQGQVVADQSSADDGEIQASSKGSSMQTMTLIQNNLPEGVYKVVLKADRDIFFRHLTTRQKYMTFTGDVYLGDEAGYKDTPTPVAFWTDAKHLSFYTYHADAAQQVSIGSGTLALPEAQVRYNDTVTDPGLVQVSAKAGDFSFTQDGKLAFLKSQFFNPDPVSLNWNTDVDALGINDIIADYTPPTTVGPWSVASVTFDLSKALTQNNDIKLVISAPGVAIAQKSVDVHAVNLTFTRPPLAFADVLQKLKTWLTHLL